MIFIKLCFSDFNVSLYSNILQEQLPTCLYIFFTGRGLQPASVRPWEFSGLNPRVALGIWHVSLLYYIHTFYLNKEIDVTPINLTSSCILSRNWNTRPNCAYIAERCAFCRYLCTRNCIIRVMLLIGKYPLTVCCRYSLDIFSSLYTEMKRQRKMQ